MKRYVIILAAMALLAGVTATGARADYGQGAVYQIGISSNLPGPNGGGIWLWIELDSSGGTYAGADCGHGLGSTSDVGDITSWSVSGGVLTIDGVILNGLGGLPVTITIPLPRSGYGHVSTDVVTIFPDLGPILGLPHGAGFSQVQVSP